MLLEVLFIKKNVIYKENFTCKEKPGSVTKVKFVTKIKKHSYLFFFKLWYYHQGCFCDNWKPSFLPGLTFK